MVFHMHANSYQHQCQQLSSIHRIAPTAGSSYNLRPGHDEYRRDLPLLRCRSPLRLSAMHLLPCSPPNQLRESAPITSVNLHTLGESGAVSAFWDAADDYVVCITPADGSAPQWFRGVMEPVVPTESEAERLRIAALMAGILPLGHGRVRYPVGSSGRMVFRGRRGGTRGEARTTVLGARAARSHRRPA